MIADVQELAYVYSDHRIICCEINHSKSPAAKILKTFRPTKSLDVTKLQRDIADAFSLIDCSTSTWSLDDLVSLYNDALKGIYDTLASIKTRWIRLRPQASWYDDNLRQAKRDKRRLERKFRKSGLKADKQQFELKCSEYNSLLETPKRNFFKSRIEQADRHQLFKLIDDLFSVNTAVLPPYDSLEQLTGDFNAFFIGKIQGLRMELMNPSSKHHDEEQRILHCEFPQFTPPSNESIKNVISSFLNKTCSLDPIPTHVIKDNISSVLSMVSGIVRESFSNGIFPTSLKTPLVRPKLKKPDLKPDLLANYRPIANIPFLSKVLEKSAAIQVHNYLNDNDLFPALQSAYRKYHSTETALLRVTDDILKTLDSSGEVILVLLDLSAAFDTLDHQILLTRLRKYFNFTETALKWFSCYLLGRSQRVSIEDATSPPRCLEYGVPSHVQYCRTVTDR